MGSGICSQLAAERARVELELQELGANYGGVVEAASVRARLQQVAADPERPHIPLRRRPLVEQHQGRVTVPPAELPLEGETRGGRAGAASRPADDHGGCGGLAVGLRRAPQARAELAFSKHQGFL